MVEKLPLIRRLGIASLALIAAIAVYSLLRSQPPTLLQPLHLANATPPGFEWIFGSAPSLLYVFSIALFLGSCAPTAANARLHCRIWIGVALVFEFAQADQVASIFSASLSPILPESARQLVAPYWERGVFDPFDLLATLIGGLLALAFFASPSAAPRSQQ